jgi:hypothetical protein
MSIRKTLTGGLLAVLWVPSVWAASDADLAQIRGEIKQLRDTYEARIAALEKRLAAAETHANQAENRAADAQTKADQAAAQAAPQATQNAFNPAVALILSGTYARLQQDPNNYQITGFIPSGGDVGPPKRSFNIGESELALSANIDPYLHGEFMLSAAPDNSVSVENAFIQTLTLPHGMLLKAGRFYSGIGYINEQHTHVWDFVDAPLAQKAFLGGQYATDGVQFRWLAPTDTFLEFGGELGRGSNFPGAEHNSNGPGGWSVFAHAGGDVGDSHSWTGGLSYLHNSPHDRQFTDNSVTDSFTGTSGLWVADLVWKWAPHGNTYYTNFKFQSEYYRRNENGDLTYDINSPQTSGFSSTQSGWYAQGVYQFLPRWRAGLRYDRLSHGTVDLGSIAAGNLPILADYDPTRTSLMFDYNPSEFSRFRLQFARDNSRKDFGDNQIMLQYIMSLGAHGAHQF